MRTKFINTSLKILGWSDVNALCGCSWFIEVGLSDVSLEWSFILDKNKKVGHYINEEKTRK